MIEAFGRPKPNFPDKMWFVEGSGAAPTEGEAGHVGLHSCAIVDKSDRGNDWAGGMDGGLEDDMNLVGFCLKRVIDDFARRDGGVAVAVLALGIDRALCIEERVVKVCRQFGEVFVLPFQFG